MSNPSDGFPSFGLSEEWLTAIGALIVQWSVFEATLTGHLTVMLKDARSIAFRPKHLKIPFNRRLNIYGELAPLFFTGQGLKNARLAIKGARAVKDDRDSFAHGMGIRDHPDNDTLTVYRVDYLNTNERRTVDKIVTRERVIAAAQVIEEARLCLLRAYASEMDVLLPLSLRGKS